MNTILDKIQARHDEQSAYERGDAGLPDVIWDDMFYIAHADRQALLDIISEISETIGMQKDYLHPDSFVLAKIKVTLNRVEP